MILKIKDGVKLATLEMLGFYYDTEDKFYTYTEDESTYIIIDENDRIININIIDSVEFLQMEDNDFTVMTEIPAIIYTLFKMDLVEII